MAIIGQRLTIDANRERGTYKFYAVQGESGGRTLEMVLFSSTGQAVDITNCRVFLYVIKPDRNVAIIEGSVMRPLVNSIVFTLTYQATTCAGTCNMFIQILSDTSDLRYDNMELEVEAAGIEGIVSRSDFGPLAALLNDAGEIGRTLSETRAMAKALGDITKEYMGGTVSVEHTGQLGPIGYSTDHSYDCVAYDTAGNILYVDSTTNGNGLCKFSTDGGETWKTRYLIPSGQTEMCFYAVSGGDKFLVFGVENFVWAHVEDDDLVIDAVQNGSGSNATGIGKYLNGKYFFIDQMRTANAAKYYNEGSRVQTVINFGANKSVADIIYDATTEMYYACGGYTQNNNSDGWLAASSDLSTWEVLATWDDMNYAYRSPLTIRNGIINIYYAGQTMNFSLRSYDIASGELSDKKTIADAAHSRSNYLHAIATRTADFIYGGGSEIVFTCDGVTFEKASLEFGDDYAQLEKTVFNLSAYGRRVAVFLNGLFSIVHADLIGEAVLRQASATLRAAEGKITELENLQDTINQWFEDSEEQFNAQLGYRITVQSDSAPIPSSAPEGTIIITYRE